ncbi:MAG: suppressor of fused domain protein [Rickettsiaceae bacterium]|nr:suppressor of fused domain protein [Rickettsiaceae bacterium]
MTNHIKILLESQSPSCPLVVVVEEGKNSTWMYLINLEKSKLGKSNPVVATAWLRNHLENKSNSIDKAIMESGSAPMLPGEFCNHPEGKQKINPEELECIWFEGGDGLALLEKGEILCIIPPWASEDYPPYSRDCIKENSLAIPLFERNMLIDVVRKAQEFWLSWDKDPWTSFKDKRLKLLINHFGEYTKYYSIDGGKWPPKSMVKFEVDNITYFITIGVSMIPQPTVEQYTDLRRFELGCAIETSELGKNEMAIAEFCSAIVRMPWDNITWIGCGHTTECYDVFSQENLFPYGVFINSKKYSNLPQVEFPDFREDTVNLLWITPISQVEFELIKDKGNDEFLKQAREKNRSLIFGNNDNKGSRNKIKNVIKGLFSRK